MPNAHRIEEKQRKPTLNILNTEPTFKYLLQCHKNKYQYLKDRQEYETNELSVYRMNFPARSATSPLVQMGVSLFWKAI